MPKDTKKATTVISIVAIVLLSIILILNLCIILQGAINPEEPPSLFGITPLVVVSGSMAGDAEDSFNEGSLVFVKNVDTATLQIGDVIAFHDPSVGEHAITTHRIVEIQEQTDGSRRFRTAGDFTGAVDSHAVHDSAVVGKYASHIGGIGSFIMFLQSPIGMLIFIGLPVLAFVIYVLLSKQRQSAKGNKKTAELEAELERLRQLAGLEAGTPTEAPTETPTQDSENAPAPQAPIEEESSPAQAPENGDK